VTFDNIIAAPSHSSVGDDGFHHVALHHLYPDTTIPLKTSLAGRTARLCDAAECHRRDRLNQATTLSTFTTICLPHNNPEHTSQRQKEHRNHNPTQTQHTYHGIRSFKTLQQPTPTVNSILVFWHVKLGTCLSSQHFDTISKKKQNRQHHRENSTSCVGYSCDEHVSGKSIPVPCFATVANKRTRERRDYDGKSQP
jgi:hypothetical protein